MKIFLTAAVFAVAAFAFTPADAQVSTDNPKVRPTYICKAKSAKGKKVYSATSRRSVALARSAALRKCRAAPGTKGCKIDSCVG